MNFETSSHADSRKRVPIFRLHAAGWIFTDNLLRVVYVENRYRKASITQALTIVGDFHQWCNGR